MKTTTDERMSVDQAIDHLEDADGVKEAGRVETFSRTGKIFAHVLADVPRNTQFRARDVPDGWEFSSLNTNERTRELHMWFTREDR